MKLSIKNHIILATFVVLGAGLPVHAIHRSSIPRSFAATSNFIRIAGYGESIKERWRKELAKHKETIIKKMLENEERYKDTHFVFYHAQQTENRIIAEFLRHLYEFIHHEPLRSDFEFLRSWQNGSDYPDINSYLDSFGIPNPFTLGLGCLNDNSPDIRAVLLSVNPVLFGNFNWAGECTWHYFLYNQSIANFIRTSLENIFTRYGFQQNFIDDFFKIHNQFPCQTGDIIQIFIPKDEVDDHTYISQAWGAPQSEHILNSDRQPIEDGYDTERKRYIKSKPILDIIQNNTQLLEDSKAIQLRLFFSNNGPLLNPDRGAKMFRFTTLNPNQLKNYKHLIKKISKKIFKTDSYIRTVQDTINRYIFNPTDNFRVLTDQEQDTVTQTIETLTAPNNIFEAIEHPNALEEIKKMFNNTPIPDKHASGWTPLMHAVEHHKLDVIEFLIKQKVDLNSQDGTGNTALMHAINYDALDIVKILITAEADMYIKNNDNQAALEFARASDSTEIVSYLEAVLGYRNLSTQAETILRAYHI
ncbi:MAG TPA: ankyrin repeat domain-containing protein [Candidatus Babeliales bacterium]|nr:ankyrin repeat domain-containing protein [Candidatus Babeliales bacterium]